VYSSPIQKLPSRGSTAIVSLSMPYGSPGIAVTPSAA